MLQSRYTRGSSYDSRSSETSIESWRRSYSDDTSRYSLAERLRRKNQELLTSTEKLYETSYIDRYIDKYRADDDISSIVSSSRTRSFSTPDPPAENQREIQRKLRTAMHDMEDYKRKYEQVVGETGQLERDLRNFKEDLEKVEDLRIDNMRLKHENGALFRVISNLSRTPRR